MALKKSVAVLIQARLNSQRFPEKVLKKINNKTIIQLICERLSFCKEINDIIVVTTKDKKDDKLVKYLSKKKFKFFSSGTYKKPKTKKIRLKFRK